MKSLSVFVVVVFGTLFASNLRAQDAAALTSPLNLVTDSQNYYNSWAKNVTDLAEAMPAEDYDWAPAGLTITKSSAPTQTFAGWVKQATDAEQRMCTIALDGKNNPLPGAADAKTKDEILGFWKKSMQTCAPLVASMTEANMGKAVQSQFGPKPLLSTLFNLTAHNREMYGEMSIFYCMKGLMLPRTSQGDPKAFNGTIYGAAGAPGSN